MNLNLLMLIFTSIEVLILLHVTTLVRSIDTGEIIDDGIDDGVHFHSHSFSLDINSTSSITAIDDRATVGNIINDIPWKDDNNELMETNKGGKITQIKYDFYWLGSTPGYILIYKSSTLGSESWKLVKRIKHNSTKELGNCHLHQHPKYYTNHIFCKSRTWFIQYQNNDNNNNREEQNNMYATNLDPVIGTYKQLPMPKDPSSLIRYPFGDHSTFYENNDLYFVVSRCYRKFKGGKCQSQTRALYVYKLNDNWTDFNGDANYNNSSAEVTSFLYEGRESPWIFKRNDMYYLVVSQTAGWKQSKTLFKRSRSMNGFANAVEEDVIMHPPNNRYIKSMGSQFRFMIQPTTREEDINSNNDKWIFGGDRYPVEAPAYWDSKYGRHVIVPMNFIDGVPHVYWKRQFNWRLYHYDSDDFDEHDHGRNGHAPIPSSNQAFNSSMATSKF